MSPQNKSNVLSVVITTHNRKKLCNYVIQSLIDHLKYPCIQWILSDDCSDPGIVDSFMDTFLQNGIVPILVTTEEGKRGQAASLNNGLKEAFKYSEIAFTTEDDWILERDFDIARYVEQIRESQIALIRLGSSNAPFREKSNYEGLDHLFGKDIDSWIFNVQVGLRNKCIYDKIGWYNEEKTGPQAEIDMKRRYNLRTNNGKSYLYGVYVPSSYEKNVMNDPSIPFVHAGLSNYGHVWDVPEKYRDLNEQDPQLAVSPSYQKTDLPFFHLIVPFYNTEKFIERCVRSILNQTFSDFVVTFVDDMSTDASVSVLERLVGMDPRIKILSTGKKMYAGGARNLALNAQTARYTLFLDSDDYYVDDFVLQRLCNHIIEKNCPDLVRCGFLQKNNLELVPKEIKICSCRKDLIPESQAPWLNAVKTEKCPRFVAYRRRCNDVVWFVRLIDSVSSITTMTNPCVVYTTENELSGFHGKVDDLCKASDYYLVGDLMSERFKTQEAEACKVRTMGIVKRRLV